MMATKDQRKTNIQCLAVKSDDGKNQELQYPKPMP